MKNTATNYAGAGQGSVKSYVIGFILSLILTIIPFALVMSKALSTTLTLSAIALFAVVQIIVQLVYFLHMNRSSEGGWNFFSFIFSLLIIGIVVIGSLWIMYNLNVNMMPGH